MVAVVRLRKVTPREERTNFIGGSFRQKAPHTLSAMQKDRAQQRWWKGKQGCDFILTIE